MTVPEILSSMALKRRTQFPDRSVAVASWATKLPFSNFDSRALELYAQHGLRDLPGVKSFLRRKWEVLVRLSLLQALLQASSL